MPVATVSQYMGAMVGVLAGDALGAPYETWDAKRIASDMQSRGGLVPFAYENPWRKEFPNVPGKMFSPGRPTDDSDQTAALAQSLIACGGLDEDDLYKRLRNVVYGHVSPLWDGEAYGAGRTTRVVLKPETFAESRALDMSDAYPSNGSLMRSVPLALFFGGRTRVDDDCVQKASQVTHRNWQVDYFVSNYVHILWHVLLRYRYPIQEHFLHLRDEKPEDPGKWPERGSVEFSFKVALWAFMNANDFRDGLTKAISIGGDTDTYGAIAGGLLGAHYGIEGIPQEWRDILIGRTVMEDLAKDLRRVSNQ